MKVIIPVAGFGKRLRPHTLTNPKVMLNVGGKPMIHYIIEQLINDKIATSIILITGFLGEKIKDYLNAAFDFKFSFIEQDEAKGLGHAVHCAEEAFSGKNDEVLIILGDTLFDVDLKKMIDNEFSVIGVKTVDDPKRFGVVEKDEKGFIRKFIEKPASKEISPSNEAIVGLYYLKNSLKLFDSLKYIMDKNITVKDEFQLTDALENMISKGERMVTYYVDGWLDCGKPETLLETNRYLLEKQKKKIKNTFKNTILIDPVYIGENCEIENSIIGPFATLNNNCIIKNSIIRDSIIENSAIIENTVLESSIIGESATVKRDTLKVNLGNHSEI